MSNHYCPVEGCDYGEDEQMPLGSVQGHINGSPDPDHDWNELQDRVEAQADDAETDDSDEDETDDEGNEDSGESAPESAESSDDDGERAEETNAEAEETDENDTETMPTDEEYEQQRADEDTENEETDESDDGDELPIPSLPVDPRTLMMLVAVAGLAWLLYRTVSGSDEESPAPDPSETAEVDTPDDDGDDEVQGGLV